MKRTILLTDTGKTNCLRITKAQALKMELALNLSQYATTWINIGNHLYNFHINRTEDDLFVTTEQFHALLTFLEQKKTECKPSI